MHLDTAKVAEAGLSAGGLTSDAAPAMTWIIVANDCRARVFEQEGTCGAIRPAMTKDLYGNCAAHAGDVKPRSPIDSDRTREFTRAVAGLLEKHLKDGRFDQLILVAPPQTLGDLKGALPSVVRSRVRSEVSRNLMNVAGFELPQYLGSALAR